MGEGTFIWVYRRGRVYREKCLRFVPHGFDLEEEVCIWHRSLEKVWGGLSPALWYLPDNLQLYLLPVSTFCSILNPSGLSEAAAAPLSLPARCCRAAGVCHPSALPQSLCVILPRPEPSHRLGWLSGAVGSCSCCSISPVGKWRATKKASQSTHLPASADCTQWLLHMVRFRKTSARFLQLLPHWNCRRLWALCGLTALVYSGGLN